MDGDADAIDYGADDPEDEDAYEEDPALSYDDENPDDEKNEVEAYDAEINEIAQTILGKMLNSLKKMTKILRKKKNNTKQQGNLLVVFFCSRTINLVKNDIWQMYQIEVRYCSGTSFWGRSFLVTRELFCFFQENDHPGL